MFIASRQPLTWRGFIEWLLSAALNKCKDTLKKCLNFKIRYFFSMRRFLFSFYWRTIQKFKSKFQNWTNTKPFYGTHMDALNSQILASKWFRMKLKLKIDESGHVEWLFPAKQLCLISEIIGETTCECKRISHCMWSIYLWQKLEFFVVNVCTIFEGIFVFSGHSFEMVYCFGNWNSLTEVASVAMKSEREKRSQVKDGKSRSEAAGDEDEIIPVGLSDVELCVRYCVKSINVILE